MYCFEYQREGNRQFKKIIKVYDRVKNELFATLQTEPYSPIIPKQTVMVQIANRQLYKRDWNSHLSHFLLQCNITPINISRIDIATDFNTFDNNANPENFLDKFMENKVLKVGHAKYHIEGEQSNKHNISYLRFGNSDSDVSIYMYDKTKELNEVKNKPYIRERWRENGIDDSKKVWRIEVSLHSNRMEFINKVSGEMFRIDMDYLKTQGMIENIFDCIFKKYWQFVHNDGQKRKDRMKPVVFFKNVASTFIPKVITEHADSNRTDKIILKKLYNVCSELRYDQNDASPVLEYAFMEWAERKDLKEYFQFVVSGTKSKYKK